MLTDEQKKLFGRLETHLSVLINRYGDMEELELFQQYVAYNATIQQQNKQLISGLEQAEFDFRFIHARYGKGDISGGDVIQYSADSGKRVEKYLQGGASNGTS
jgi:hypothetical protein